MNRKFLPYLIFLLLAAFAVSASNPVCCVGADSCFDNPNADAAFCTSDGQTRYPNQACSQIPECATGCCCATANEATWNALPEGNLKIQKVACELNADPYYLTWTALTAPAVGGRTCSEFCQDVQPVAVVTYRASGNVLLADESTPVVGALVSITTTISPYGTLTTTTDANGAYSFTAVPAGTWRIVVYKAGCEPSTSLTSPDIVFNGDKTYDFAAPHAAFTSCTAGGCMPVAPTVTATLEPASSNIVLGISYNADCGKFAKTIVQRELKATGSTVVIEKTTKDAEIPDGPLVPNTEYCYTVSIQHGAGLPTVTSDEVCTTTGDPECMRGLTSWCDHDPQAIVTCDAETNTASPDACDNGMICRRTGPNAHECVPALPCEQCNGIFGILASLGLRLPYEQTLLSCGDSRIASFCFEDRTLTAIDAYAGCSEIASCANYRSESACADDLCALEQGCAWRPVDAYSELGLGICVPTTRPASCGDCESVFGTCTEELCEAIGKKASGPSDCYWDGRANSVTTVAGLPLANRCLDRAAMACQYYDTQDDCVGAGAQRQPAELDVTYALPNVVSVRTGTTNAITKPSNDPYSFRVCRWQADSQLDGGGFCFRDASGDSKNAASPLDDCHEKGYHSSAGKPTIEECWSDAEPPVTALLAPASVIGTHEIGAIAYTVSDNLWPASDISTWFCIEDADAPTPCYPDKTLSAATTGASELSIGEQGSFNIRYYSEDPAGNLEVVKERTLTIINLGYPTATDVQIH